MKKTTTIKTIGPHKVRSAAGPRGVDFVLLRPGCPATPIFTVPAHDLAPLHDALAVEVARRILNQAHLTT